MKIHRETLFNASIFFLIFLTSFATLIPFSMVLNHHFYNWGDKFSFHYKKDISNIINKLSSDQIATIKVADTLDNSYNHIHLKCKSFSYVSNTYFNKEDFTSIEFNTPNCDIVYYTKKHKSWFYNYISYIVSFFKFELFIEDKYWDFILCHITSFFLLLSLFYLIRSRIRLNIIKEIIQDIDNG